MHIDLFKTIQVRHYKNGRLGWVTGSASTISVSETTVDVGDGGTDKWPVITILFSTDVGGITVNDIFGMGSENWRYKEPCCEQCRFASREGGDIVPYGSTTCTTPEGWVCEHEAMEDIENPYEETGGGTTCGYHQFIEE